MERLFRVGPLARSGHELATSPVASTLTGEDAVFGLNQSI
jgi:hypothetical protein